VNPRPGIRLILGSEAVRASQLGIEKDIRPLKGPCQIARTSFTRHNADSRLAGELDYIYCNTTYLTPTSFYYHHLHFFFLYQHLQLLLSLCHQVFTRSHR